MSPQPEVRIGDAEREAAVAALGDHYAAGRLTKEEYDERSGQAYAARTRSGLLPLFADLPRAEGAAPGPTGGSRTSGPAPRRRSGWWEGAWLVPVLVVAGVLLVVTHLPLVVLLVLGWVLLARGGRRWGACHSRRDGHRIR